MSVINRTDKSESTSSIKKNNVIDKDNEKAEDSDDDDEDEDDEAQLLLAELNKIKREKEEARRAKVLF
jgi:hypothetical protein